MTELIVWTQYEIQVAAYNGAGLGVFSRAVAEYSPDALKAPLFIPSRVLVWMIWI